MSFELRIYMAGLNLYVPTAADRACMVLMRDTNDQNNLIRRGHRGQQRIARHTPFLWAPGASPEDLAGKRVEFSLASDMDTPLPGSLSFAACTHGNSLEYCADCGECPPSADDADAFHWLTSLGLILGQEESRRGIDPKWLECGDDLPRDPAKGLVTAQVLLTAGTLGTGRLVQYDDRIARIKYDTGHLTSKPRAAAEVMYLSCPDIDDEGLAVRFRALRDCRIMDDDTVVLRPDDDGVIAILIANLPPESRRQRIGYHFGLFAGLLLHRASPARDPIPMVDGYCDPDCRQPEIPGFSPGNWADAGKSELGQIHIMNIDNRPICPGGGP